MGPTEQLAEILPALNEAVGQIRTDQLDNPTPCDQFSVPDVSSGTKIAVDDCVITAVDAFARTALAEGLRDGDTLKAPTEPRVLSAAIDELAAFSGRTVTT